MIGRPTQAGTRHRARCHGDRCCFLQKVETDPGTRDVDFEHLNYALEHHRRSTQPVEYVGHSRCTQTLKHDTQPIEQFLWRVTRLMLVRQVISQTRQRRHPTLYPAPNRLQLPKELVFKPHPACVRDAIDGVEREHDTSRLKQEIRIAYTVRGRGDPVDIQVCYGRRDRSVRSKRDEQALGTLTASTLHALGDPLWVQYRTPGGEPIIYS